MIVEDPKYVVYISMKDDEGKIKDHPLRPFHLEAEANWWLNGYVDAVVNHTGETDIHKIYGQFRIERLGDDNDSDAEAKTIGTEDK